MAFSTAYKQLSLIPSSARNPYIVVSSEFLIGLIWKSMWALSFLWSIIVYVKLLTWTCPILQSRFKQKQLLPSSLNLQAEKVFPCSKFEATTNFEIRVAWTQFYWLAMWWNLPASASFYERWKNISLCWLWRLSLTCRDTTGCLLFLLLTEHNKLFISICK